MIVDGKAIAADVYKEIKNELSHMGSSPHLTIFTCAPNFATQKYLRLKKNKCKELGLGVNIIELPATSTTEDFIQTVKHSFIQTDGVIVQLPLPRHIDTDAVLWAIPKELDVDGVNYEKNINCVLPPVVGAIDEIARRHRVVFGGSNIVILGEGRLVGSPAKLWTARHGWQSQVVTEITPHPEKFIQAADILILGTGQAGLVTPNKIKKGVVIFDAGTSESGGKLVGDATADCALKAALITPVPGGIGPLTVAVLLRNLVLLAKKSQKI
jgi:5,10-methylene-tetrahydrofolate dehydrogenase/methenyl tetrahydrofolate cyclohydrolase